MMDTNLAMRHMGWHCEASYYISLIYLCDRMRPCIHQDTEPGGMQSPFLAPLSTDGDFS